MWGDGDYILGAIYTAITVSEYKIQIHLNQEWLLYFSFDTPSWLCARGISLPECLMILMSTSILNFSRSVFSYIGILMLHVPFLFLNFSITLLRECWFMELLLPWAYLSLFPQIEVSPSHPPHHHPISP